MTRVIRIKNSGTRDVKKLIIAAIALLLFGSAGFMALAFINNPAEASEAKEEGEGPPAPTFVEMKPLVLPVLDKEGVSQIVSIVVSLETDTPEKAKEVEALKPRLTDAYIQGMYGVLSSKEVMADGILQVEYIKGRLNKITSKVLGENKVKDVLLQVVQQRNV